MKRTSALNIPNVLTLFRIFLVPFLVVVLLTEFKFERWFFLKRELLAVVLLVTASVTDILDGYLARKKKQVTTLGVLLDPIADKLLVVSALISLVELRLVPAWVAVIIVGREFSVMGLRMVAALHKVVIPAGQLGKWKMALEIVAICFVLGGAQQEWALMNWMEKALGLREDLQAIVLHWLTLTGLGLFYFVAFIALVSLAEYCVHFTRRIDLFQAEEAAG
jgi:CDP-diacylglycerol--glycerol-3-phosphate 3-phosphatidyltransferase